MLDIVNKRREIQQQQQQHSSSLEVRRVNTSTTTTHTTPHSSSNSIPTPLLVQLFALRRQFTYLKSINEIQPSNTLLLDHLHSRFPSLSRDSISVLLSTYNTPETDIEGGGSGSAKMVWVEDLLEWRRSNNGKKSE